MRYLHTMVRVESLEASMKFYCDILGLVEVKRTENQEGRFTLVFLTAPADEERAKEMSSPCLELTYNWPEKGREPEKLTGGRSFGHLAYRVENIYETCAALQKAGVTINRPPRDGNMAFVRSPEGISIELLQEGAHLEPKEPWASMGNTGTW